MATEAEIEAGCRATLRRDNKAGFLIWGEFVHESRWPEYREIVTPILEAAERVRAQSSHSSGMP